jgi:hypothetical protein
MRAKDSLNLRQIYPNRKDDLWYIINSAMKTRMEMYQKAIAELHDTKMKEVQLMTRAQKINIGVECVLFVGMIVTVYILVNLTPSLL